MWQVLGLLKFFLKAAQCGQYDMLGIRQAHIHQYMYALHQLFKDEQSICTQDVEQPLA